MTSKQRAYLRSLGNSLTAIFQVGKSGVGPELVQSVSDALEARELIKLSVLENSPLMVREAAEMISSRTHSEVVQVIGNKFILYRKATKNPKIELPKK